MSKINDQRPIQLKGKANPLEPEKAVKKQVAEKFKAAMRESAPTAEPEAAETESAPAAAAPQQAPAKGSGGKAEVPDSWKHPEGPYHQAPAEYGGEWWYVSPFTGSEPWKTQGVKTESTAAKAKAGQSFPDGFLETFPKPERSQFKDSNDFVHAKSRWEQDLKYFKRAGIPEGVPRDQIDAATAIAQQWGMGTPKFYEGRYGWMVRFPESKIPTFETDLNGVTLGMHQTVARYQVRMMQNGMRPTTRHPFVPPHVEPKVKD
jgi:hypothetical protein